MAPSVAYVTAVRFFIIITVLIELFPFIISFSSSATSGHDSPYIRRRRRSVASIFAELGPIYQRRAYRMDVESFWKLHRKLKSRISGTKNRKRKRRGAVNGFIPSATRLSVAIRYFAGGSSYDIALVHGISHSEVFKSIWKVVDAVNQCEGLRISYPVCYDQQKQIADAFRTKSKAKFDCCAGAIDGLLVWIEKPTQDECEHAEIGPKKFMCGRKKKFGLNLQAICDASGRFLDVAILHPGSTSDYLAFVTSPIHHKLEQPGFLADGLCIFGDNAYVNTNYMATPFKGVQPLLSNELKIARPRTGENYKHQSRNRKHGRALSSPLRYQRDLRFGDPDTRRRTDDEIGDEL